MRVILVFLSVFVSINLVGQCPPAFSYDVDMSFCQSETVEITNVTNGGEYLWDFCSGDIENGFSSEAIVANSAFVRNRTIKVVNDADQWYAFAISQTSSNLQRINLGSDLDNSTPVYNNIGTFSGSLNRPYDLDLIFGGVVWHAFVSNTNNGTLARLDFVNGLEEDPDLVDLGNFAGAIQNPLHVSLIEEAGNYYAFVSDEETIVRISFGADLENSSPSVDVFAVAGSNTLRGFSLSKDCDSWVGIVLSYSTNQLFSIDFGTSLMNVPTFSLLPSSNTIRFPANIEIVNENANFYGFVQGALGNFYQLDFGTSVADFVFSDEEVDDLLFTSNQNFALDIVTDNSRWYGFNFNLDNQQLIQFSFADNCDASILTSDEQIPSGLKYSVAGTHNISTQFIDLAGNVDYSTRPTIVSGEMAPDISFSIDESRCIANSNTFTPSLPGLASYSWDFDGDDVVDSSVETPTFQFSSPGTYIVRLDVSDGTCGNFTEQEITIYPDLVDPSFDITSNDFCEQTTFTLTNTIDASAYNEAISYEWYLNGALMSTQRDTTYVFENAGEKIIGLKSFISGCESTTTEQSIQIIPSPTADFASDTVCLSQTSVFSNLSVNANSYSWDFGDGNASTLFEPSHVYADTGTYIVQLTAFDGSGDCAGVVSKAVRVNRIPPTPSFNLVAPFCIGSEIDLINLTEDDSFDGVSYEWTITDFESVSDKNVSISFSEPGEKIFQLQTFYRSCESEIVSQAITIANLPIASFSAPTTCSGDSVVFINESIDGSSYLWDFGDGSMSSDLDPSHLYAFPDTYSVSLSVTDLNGCEDQYQRDVVVLNLPEVAFDFEIACTANGGVLFTDNSSIENSEIVSWTWLVDGELVSIEQNPNIVFSVPGSKLVQLEISSAEGCESSYQETIDVTSSIPDLSSFDDDLCIDEPLSIVNANSELSYQWDFCAGDIEEGFLSEAISTTNSFSRNRTIKVIEDAGNWYAFAVSQTSNNLQRIDLGSNLSNAMSPTFNDLGEFDDALNGAYDLELIFDGTMWRAFVANTGNSEIIRFDFVDGISSVPSMVNLGDFSGGIHAPTHTLLLEDDGSYFGFVSGEEDLVRLSFGSDLTSDPVVDVIAVVGSNTLRGLSLTKDCDSWVGLLLSYGSNSVYSVNFSSSLSSTPVIDELTLSNGVVFPANVEIINENANFYAFIQGALGNFYRFDFGTSISDFSFLEQSIDDPAFTSDQNFALDIVTQNSEWFGFNFNLDSRELVQFSFLDDCSAGVATSTERSPSEISYTSSGDYSVSSRVETSSGEVGYASNSVSVSTDTAPDITFTIDPSRCINNPNTFTPSLTGLSSYSWDFGDGSSLSTLENPTHQYLSPGTYTVRLDVTDGTCGNFVEQEITIYPEPSTPTFTAETLVCINSEIAFTNTTDETGFDDVLSYEWDFNGEGSSTEREPSFVFTTSGMKAVTLTSSIPGCEATSEVFEIEISAGPTAAFNPSSFGICEEEFIAFSDVSTNGAISWNWDFGDGFTSTAQNPDHLFTTAGNYIVSLSVTDALGCESTVTEEVSIAALPTVSFDFDVACTSSDGIQFMDLSTVEGADIVSRTWFVDAAEVNTEENPILGFESEGSVNIRLEVVSSNGCTSSYSEDIQILPVPQPDFAISIGCEGEPTSFIDLTASAGNPVGTWLWSVDGATYNTQNVSHTFSGVGMFEVTLEVTGQNFCSETITDTVVILELPEVGFSIDGDCSNEFIALADTSIIFQDPIVSRNWYLDGASVGNGPELLLEALPQSTYDLVLEVTTALGCVTSSTQELLINSTPASAFELERNFGVPGDEIIFTNESSEAVSYQWLFNGNPNGTESGEKIVTFTDPGTHEISLVSTNSVGCSDTTSTQVLIAVPVVDLSIGQFEVVNTNNNGRIFIEIENNSNLPIEVTEAVIELENQFSVTEQVETLIGVGQSQLVGLNTGIPLSTTELSYLCVTLNSQYADYPDLTPVNNEKCISIQPNAIVVEAPYPNPATTETRVKLVAPMEGNAVISLFNSSGKVEFSYTEEVDAGLNNFFLNVGDLQAGIYFVRLQFNGTTSVQRIIKL